MSIETDLIALLAANPGVSGLVGTKIAHNAAGQAWAPPYVVFTATHDYVDDLDGVRHADACTLTVQCWSEGSTGAEQLADAVAVALDGAPAIAGVVVNQRASSYDEATGLDGVVLAVQWWSMP